jgi:hypothetical protein
MRKITLALAAAGLIAVAVPATSSAADVAVCNEAENSFQGGYVVDPAVDPSPPAFLRGEQMRLGNGDGAGLENAAERSPALAVCTPVGEDTDGDGGGGGGYEGLAG